MRIESEAHATETSPASAEEDGRPDLPISVRAQASDRTRRAATLRVTVNREAAVRQRRAAEVTVNRPRGRSQRPGPQGSRACVVNRQSTERCSRSPPAAQRCEAGNRWLVQRSRQLDSRAEKSASRPGSMRWSPTPATAASGPGSECTARSNVPLREWTQTPGFAFTSGWIASVASSQRDGNFERFNRPLIVGGKTADFTGAAPRGASVGLDTIVSGLPDSSVPRPRAGVFLGTPFRSDFCGHFRVPGREAPTARWSRFLLVESNRPRQGRCVSSSRRTRASRGAVVGSAIPEMVL